jgi:hypothetical protein
MNILLDDVMEIGALWNTISKDELVIRVLDATSNTFDIYLTREQAENLEKEIHRLLIKNEVKNNDPTILP